MGTLADLMGSAPASDGSQMDLFKWYDQFRDSPWPPRRLWPADLERTDTERILYYQGNALALRNGELWVAGSNGLWAPGRTERGKASLRDRIISGREAAREELRNNQPLLDLEDWWYQLDVRQRHWNAVLVNVCDYLQARGQSVHDIPAVPDARWDSQRGVVPVLDPVGALDLKDAGQFLNPDQLLPMYVEDRGWEIPVPDLYAPIHTDAWDIIEQRYGWILAERMAAALLGPGKNIDAIIVEMPNWGKDAWISWLELCLPGAVAQFPNSSVLSERGNRFSQAYYPLTQSVLVFFNECDKLDRNIPPGTLNAMVADRLVIELKYVNPRDIKRVGTPVFVGNGKPVLDGTQLGTDARFQWAYWPSEEDQETGWPYVERAARYGVGRECRQGIARLPVSAGDQTMGSARRRLPGRDDGSAGIGQRPGDDLFRGGGDSGYVPGVHSAGGWLLGKQRGFAGVGEGHIGADVVIVVETGVPQCGGGATPESHQSERQTDTRLAGRADRFGGRMIHLTTYPIGYRITVIKQRSRHHDRYRNNRPRRQRQTAGIHPYADQDATCHAGSHQRTDQGRSSVRYRMDG